MHAKYEVSISYGSKVIAKVKVDNRQTNQQINRQDKYNMPPIIRSGGIKSSVKCTTDKLRLTRLKFLLGVQTSRDKHMQTTFVQNF